MVALQTSFVYSQTMIYSIQGQSINPKAIRKIALHKDYIKFGYEFQPARSGWFFKYSNKYVDWYGKSVTKEQATIPYALEIYYIGNSGFPEVFKFTSENDAEFYFTELKKVI